MNYKQTLEYLYACLPMFHRVGAAAYKADLNNTIALCDLLGNPQNHFPTIHIAGTNGKGSVSHTLASILQCSGLKTGLYTSPHLKDFRERIRIDGKMIGKRYVSSFITRYQKEFEAIRPSFFELTVGMAFQYFREQKVDIAVIETGLGGRLDSTNIIRPLLSVITNISYDHQHLLGETLQQIAFEKAGIIKPDIPVVIGETQPGISSIFEERSRELKAPLVFADQHFSAVKCCAAEDTLQPGVASRSLLLEKSRAVLTMDIFHEGKLLLQKVESPLPGWYQLKNTVTVAAAWNLLKSTGFRLTTDHLRKGIEQVIVNTGLAGRWQWLGTHPPTLCDTGHNESGLNAVTAQLKDLPYENLHWVLGVVNDKDLGKILPLLPVNATWYFCKPAIPRGLEATILQEKALQAGLRGSVYPSVKKALQAARKAASDRDLVFVGGSTFVVAEVI